MPEKMMKESLEPSELAYAQRTGLQLALAHAQDIVFGPERWMPLNAALQALIDKGADFSELVECATHYAEIDLALQTAVDRFERATLLLETTGDSGRL